MKKTFDLIIPLGSFCATSEGLRRNKLQCESYPFDWLKDAQLPYCIEYISNNFSTFLKKDNLRKENGTSGMHDVYTDIPTQIISSHDFMTSECFDNSYQKVMAKYSRRIERLYQRIDEAQKVLMVSCSEKHFDDAELIRLRDKMQAVYPQKDFHLAYIHIDNAQQADEKRELSPKVTHFNIHNLDTNDYKACCKAISKLMKGYDICLKLKLKRMLPNLYFVIRKPALKLIEKLPLGKAKKSKIRTLYKDKY